MKHFRYYFIFIIPLVLICNGPAWASASNGATTPFQLAAPNLDLAEMNQFLSTLDSETQKLLPRLDPASWGLTGPEWNLGKIGSSILRYFLRELVFNLRL